MINTKRLFLSFLILVLSFSAHASSVTKKLEIQHPEFEVPLVFNVVLPSGYQGENSKHYPVLFDFHPHATTYLRGMHDWMSHNGEWPWLKTIIITLDYGNPVGKLFDSSGETTPLLDFFEQELFVEIDKTYRTNGFRIMSGFRHNGSIVLSALFRKPDMLNAYIAVSPELKDDFVGLQSDSRKMLSNLDKKPRFLLFSYGTNVKENHQQDDYMELSKTLQQYAPSSLDWHEKHFADNYFMSLPILSTVMGVEALFDDVHNGLAPDSAVSKQGVNKIVAHYKFLSDKKYGFEVSPKRSIQNLGNHLIGSNPEKGLSVLKQLIELYPDDSYSYHYVAEAYASLGDFENAVKFQTDAVKYSENQQTWHQKKHRAALDQYQFELSGE
ncbi:esterase [Idiomarina sp. M1R2S28]|uniref:Esterase n=1 Tax=Idiomarina rhizosphaerae TaxID=2961572 RepID=A0A9X2G4I2_9GAMM|nr:esterase [Idiomarina rhizosphaerae]MCP1340238.1 esterase [Idiomarina rhizosphaerae]